MTSPDEISGVSEGRATIRAPFRFIGPPPLHRPERLQDAELLRHPV